jgi:Flp pilus assembly protein TadG
MTRSKRPARNGQALAEFALVLPVLLLLIFGIIELGRVVFIYNSLADAARQGARVAAVNQRDTGSGSKCDPLDRPSWTIVACIRKTAVSFDLTYSPNSQNSNIQICYQQGNSACQAKPADSGGTCKTRDPSAAPACLAVITVSYPYQPITPIINEIVGTVQMSSTSQMPVEAWYP